MECGVNNNIIQSKRVVALGYFDGVHLGHAQLLKRVIEVAKEQKLTPSVLTFDSHPQSVIDGLETPLINSLEDRIGLINRMFGITDIITLPFDEETISMKWDNFIDHLIEKYGACHLVAGHNFRFGKDRVGTSELLQQKCREIGIGCDIIPEVVHNGIICNSSYIRELLVAGELEKANEFLGHPHVLTDIVRIGQKLGRTIDAPTVNMQFAPGVLIPAHGVYAVKVFISHIDEYVGVTNIGIRPTVDDSNKVTVETHIPRATVDLYGQQVRLEFHKFIRPERKFDSVEELKEQIKKDCPDAMDWFDK